MIQTETLSPEIARRKANVWLLNNMGNLLRAENPKLLLGEQPLWRFDIRLTVPELGGSHFRIFEKIGQIRLDAITGEVVISGSFIDELQLALDDAANAKIAAGEYDTVAGVDAVMAA